MTRTDGMVSSGPRTEGLESLGGEVPGRPGRSWSRDARRCVRVLPLVLALMIPAAPAVAQSSPATSGYKQSVPKPKTSPEPKSGTEPSKSSAPAPKAATEPAVAKAAAPAESKLPFTGLDLRWVLGAGVLLLAAGFSLRYTQRHGTGR